MCEDLRGDHPHIDVLVNNAGAFELQRVTSQDGFEITFAVNVLAPFCLTYHLLDLLRGGEQARIVNVASISQSHSPPDFDNLNQEKGYSAHNVRWRGRV